jgi:hypothetical protein
LGYVMLGHVVGLHYGMISSLIFSVKLSIFGACNTVRSESHCALRLRYLDLVVSIEVSVEACCCFTVFNC